MSIAATEVVSIYGILTDQPPTNGQNMLNFVRHIS